jgi:hypothetical protein
VDVSFEAAWLLNVSMIMSSQSVVQCSISCSVEVLYTNITLIRRSTEEVLLLLLLPTLLYLQLFIYNLSLHPLILN